MVTIKKRRLINPHKKAAAKKVGSPRAKRAYPKKANPGQLITLGFVNPQRGSMKKQKTKKNPARRPKSNPIVNFKASPLQKKYRPRRRNPMSESLKTPVDALRFGLMALLGLVATRQVPQLVLGAKNTGWIGYAGNLFTAVASGAAAGKFAGKPAGNAVMVGGGLYLVNRILSEQFTPVGKVLSLAGVGDAQASATLGRIRPGTVYPPAYDKNGNLKLPQTFVDAMQRRLPAPAAAPAAKVSGVRGNRMVAGRV